MPTTLFTALICFVLFLGVFLALRAIMLWYWKVDTIVENQDKQTALLRQQNALLQRQVELLDTHIKQMDGYLSNANRQ